MRSRTLCSLALAAALSTVGGAVHALGVTDARGDYVPGYSGSTAGDLDVVGSFVTYNVATDRFVFSGTMDADIGLTPAGFYVWGVDRGGGTARFAANGIGGVLFDAVVILRPDGTGTVSLLAGPVTGATALPAGTALSVGSTILGQIEGALLPGNGFAKTDYTWNLWPRDGALPAGFGQISDFAPDNSNLRVTVLGAVPEPASVATLALGLLALGALGAKRRRGRAPGG